MSVLVYVASLPKRVRWGDLALTVATAPVFAVGWVVGRLIRAGFVCVAAFQVGLERGGRRGTG